MSANHGVLSFPSSKFGSGAAQPGTSPLLVGPSPAIAQLWGQIRRVAPHFRSALLTGEVGSGAEHVARSLHGLSSYADRPFVRLNRAAAEERLRAKLPVGVEGMLYLSAVEALSPPAQAGLLRVLQQRGEMAVRVVGFARSSLRPLISAGGFSAPLAGTLGAVTIAVPALRERVEDVAMLLEHHLQRHAAARGLAVRQVGAAFVEAARAGEWPGNIEQLSAVCRWLVEQRTEALLEPADLEAAIAATKPVASAAVSKTRMVKLDEIVEEHVRGVLMACHGNKLRAAEVLGISRSTLYRMLEASSLAIAS